MGSVSAFTGHPDLWYGATKAAIINITKTYSSQFSKFGILFNAVAPGPTKTDMYNKLPLSRKKISNAECLSQKTMSSKRSC